MMLRIDYMHTSPRILRAFPLPPSVVRPLVRHDRTAKVALSLHREAMDMPLFIPSLPHYQNHSVVCDSRSVSFSFSALLEFKLTSIVERSVSRKQFCLVLPEVLLVHAYTVELLSIRALATDS